MTDGKRARRLKVSLINPTYFLSGGAVRHYWFPPPIGVVSVAASLRSAGWPVQVIDAIAEDIHGIRPAERRMVSVGLSHDDILRRIGSYSDVIGLSLMFSNNWRFHKDLILKIRRAYPRAVIVVGGEHVTALPEFTLVDADGALDFAVLGEGEETTLELLEALERSGRGSVRGLEGIAGLEEGGYFETRRGRVRDVDKIPRPDWSMIPIENYLGNATGQASSGRRTIPIVASRGCPYRCSFCSNDNMWGNLWRARKPELVVDEIEECVRRFRVDTIEFYDLTAVINKRWTLRFCEILAERRLDVRLRLPTGTRSEALDEETLRALYSAGCEHLTYAPESGSEHTLERMRKKIRLENLLASMRSAVRIGFETRANFIVGSPEETHRDVLKTLLLAVRCAVMGLKEVGVLPMTPYPGSEDFRRLTGEGRFPPPHSPDFIRRIEENLCNNPFGVRSYSRHISSAMLWFYVYGGFFLFYSTAYLTRPWRILKSAFNLVRGRQEGFLERIAYLSAKSLLLRMRGRMALEKGFS